MSSIQEFLNPVYEVGAWGLLQVFFATCFAALLAAIALAVNLLFRRWLTAGQMNLLWALVLMRLMLPIGPPSSFSLQGAMWKLLEEPREAVHEREPAWRSATYETIASDRGNNATRKEITERSAPASSADGANKDVTQLAAEERVMDSNSPADVAAGSSESLWIENAISTVFFQFLLVWPCAAVGIILWTMFVNFRFSWKVNRTSFCRDERLAALWAACCQQAKVRRTIPIVLLETVQQPAMMGAFHHRLLLPQDALQLSDDELRMIMLHELVHVRRWDIAINWALVFVRAIHWWNPVYWLAASRFAATREQACDAFVIRTMSGNSSRSYGELLLKLAEKMPSRSRWRVLVPTPILGFMLSAFRRRTIAVRLRALPRSAIARSRWHKLAIAAGTILLAYAGLTNAKTASDERPPKENENIFPGTFERTDVWPAETNRAEEPVVARDYEVGLVLRHIAGQRYSLDEAKTILAATVWPMPPHKDHPQCEFDGTNMTVTTKESFHQELEQNLIAWEKSGLEQIAIKCCFITFRQELVSRMNIPWRYFAASSPNLRMAGKNGFPSNTEPQPPLLPHSADQATFRASAQMEEPLPVVYAILNPKQTAYVVAAAQGDAHTNILQAPKPTVFNGTRCFLSDVSQRPFVVGVTAVAGKLATALQPEIAIADQGMRIFLRPILSSDHRRIGLNGRFEFSDVRDVQSASVSPIAGDPDPASIQVPNLTRLQIDIATELENGHSLLLGSLIDRLDDERKVSNLYVLLTPTLISEDGDAAK